VVAEGLLTPPQLADALAEKRTNERLSTVLVRLGLVAEEQLANFFSIHYAIPLVTLPDTPVPTEISKLVPAAIVRKHEVVPVWRTTASITLAIADATNLAALDDVAFLTGLQVVPAIATRSSICQTIERSYDSVDLTEMFADADNGANNLEILQASEELRPDALDLKESADQMPIVRLVNMILIDAISRGASDVHLEANDTSFRVRFRIDGVLTEIMAPPRRLEPAVISRIKILADLDIAERRLPQDGRIRLRYNSREVDFRVSVIPTIFGESVSLRLLDKDSYKLSWRDLGLDQWSQERLEGALRSPHGMLLVTGPTGSGKTTTLYSAIHRLNSPDVNIVTAEDPVEYKLPGINQVQINEDIGRSFAAVLRSFLRHDPNVILVGEMRDTETAQIAVRASLTGHLVLSTLHTNDCASSAVRLVDMGIPPFLVASSLRLVVAQRLVRKLCAECREPYPATEEDLSMFGPVAEGIGARTLYRSRGCLACGFVGLRGRIALYETMPMTREIRAAIVAGQYGEIQALAERQGMKPLRAIGLEKVIDGITTVAEVLRVTSV
jgi:type IV pilus assembly protein PilB